MFLILLMQKDYLISRKYEVLNEITRINEVLHDNQYNKMYNGKLSVMTKQLRNINIAINAY